MDQIRDYEPFKRLVMRLCVTFDKFANDELIESWWKALRTVPLVTLERGIDDFIMSATDKTKFPRPGQFRPADMAVANSAEDARDRRILAESNRNWVEFIKRYPQTGPIKFKMAQASRVMASAHESSPAYDGAQHEYFALEKMLGQHGRFCADC